MATPPPWPVCPACPICPEEEGEYPAEEGERPRPLRPPWPPLYGPGEAATQRAGGVVTHEEIQAHTKRIEERIKCKKGASANRSFDNFTNDFMKRSKVEVA